MLLREEATTKARCILEDAERFALSR